MNVKSALALSRHALNVLQASTSIRIAALMNAPVVLQFLAEMNVWHVMLSAYPVLILLILVQFVKLERIFI